jgi:hypothetical protein
MKHACCLSLSASILPCRLQIGPQPQQLICHSTSALMDKYNSHSITSEGFFVFSETMLVYACMHGTKGKRKGKAGDSRFAVHPLRMAAGCRRCWIAGCWMLDASTLSAARRNCRVLRDADQPSTPARSPSLSLSEPVCRTGARGRPVYVTWRVTSSLFTLSPTVQ